MTNDFEVFLKNVKPADVVLVGIGNTLKGDDAAGSILAARLQLLPNDLSVLDAGSVPENHIGKIIALKKPILIFADAMDFKGEPGEFKIFNINDIYDGNIATHSFSLGFLTDLIRSEVDCSSYVLGIQPVSMKMGEAISEQVRMAIDRLIALVAEWVITNQD